MKKILVPTDFSSAARAALRHALDLAAQSPAEIILLHVVAPSESGCDDGVMKRATKKVGEFWRSEGDGSNRCKAIVRSGIPFVEIMQSAKDAGADLIVLGRPDQTAAGDGHTVDRIARYASSPVLLVRETGGKHPFPP